jgi:hypothetical protein
MQKYGEPLRTYVTKCFSQCANDQTREIVSARLLEKIATVSAQGRLNLHNWVSEPLMAAPAPSPAAAPKPRPPPPPKPPPAPAPAPAPPQGYEQYAAYPGFAYAPYAYPPAPAYEGYPVQYYGGYPAYAVPPVTTQYAPGQVIPPEPPSFGAPEPPPAPAFSVPERAPVDAKPPAPPVISSGWKPPPIAPTFEHPPSTLSGKPPPKPKKRKAKKEAEKDDVVETRSDKPALALPLQPDIVGTSTALEKQYLRLTGESDRDPSLFRALPALKRSFDHCMAKYATSGDYDYISEQLRSIRQDLTVQHITDPFCMTVYETHAKLAIVQGDLNNFNQAMDVLGDLYPRFGTPEQMAEFGCWRILYLIGVDDLSGLYQFVPRLPAEVTGSEPVQFALSAWKAAVGADWVKFLEMMRDAAPLRAGVMRVKANAIRTVGLQLLQHATRKMALDDYTRLLLFENDQQTIELFQKLDLPPPPS